MNGKNAYDELSHVYKEIQDDEIIMEYDCENVLKEANRAFQNLVEFTRGIRRWNSDKWAEHKPHGDELIRVFRDQFAVLLEYSVTLQDCYATKKKSIGKSKRQSRLKVVQVENRICEGLPRPVSKTFAAIYHGMDDFSKGWSQLAPEYESLPSFKNPCVFFEESSASAWHTYLTEARAELKDQAKIRLEKGIAKLEKFGKKQRSTSSDDTVVKQTASHAACPLTPMAEAIKPGEVNDVESSPVCVFDCTTTAQLPPSLHIQEAWCWSKEQADNPFLPVPCFIQVTRNQFLIAFLSIEEMALAGKNLHEVKEYCRFV